MLDENSSGAAYLARLKQSAPQGTGTAPALATIPNREKQAGGETSRSSANPHPAEKRKSPRYRCQGSAHLRETSRGVATWATFTDISLHGCYVEAMSTFSVRTDLALTIEVNGFRVECEGKVRVVYPNLGMGISFTKISERDRERLSELLRSLSRPSVILGAPSPTDLRSAPHDSSSHIANPAAVLQAVEQFFEERHVLGREEFFKILGQFQNSVS